MPSAQVPVLGSLFVSFRPSLIRFPQLFLRCFPSALAFGLFRFPSASFRPLLFRLRLLGPLFFRSLLPGLASSVASPVPRFFLSASPFSTFSSAWFPMLLFRFPVLGFLFVSFHPSRLRSHSCSTGASLLFRFLASASFPGFSACLPVSFVPISLLLTTQPSALSFPLFPISPGSGSLGARPFLAVPSLSSSVGPVSMPSFRFRYSASCISFLQRCPASQWLLQRLSLPISLRPRPHGFRFRIRLLGLSVLNFSVPHRTCIYYHRNLILSTPILYIFQLFSYALRP